MQNKRRKIMFIISVALIMVLFTSVLAVNSYSRYVVEENAKYNDGNNTMDYIDYTVNSVFVVRTQDELFSAINNGYSYVQLDKNIENPLIVTQNAETLDRDLILDLNGIEIQRNGYDPILKVQSGVRLTVVDTSTEQTGGLYNPVGSVFQINGGILTVVAGTFESGPRYSEYYSYNNRVLNNDGDTKRTLIEDTKQVKLYTKSGESFVSKGEEAPIIRSYPQKTGEITYNRGNLYFDETVSRGAFTIKPDTYCYYRTSEDSAANSTEISTADWYYTYYVKASNYDYVSADEPTDKTQDYVQITIYGYENVVNKAASKTNASDYHAAIQMTSGTLDVQSGSFNQYFGVDKTACVNAQGGEINIKRGSFSSRVPNALSFNPSTVLIKESDKVSFNESYFDNFTWNTENTDFVYQLTVDGTDYNGRLARNGQAYCILNGGNANVTVGTGDLYSSNNNIISMQGGDLSINGGNFTKRETIVPALDGTNAAVNISNGNLSLSDATCNVFGTNSVAVRVDEGKLTIDKSRFNVNGENSYGIRSYIESQTNFTVKNSDFTINGKNSTGIYSEKGRVNISSTGTNSITIDGEGAKGIYVLNNGSVHSTNYTYTVSGNNSYGIDGAIDASGLNINGGAMTVKGSSTFGINSLISGDNNFTVTDFSITMSDGTNQTAIYSANGKVVLSTTKGAKISVDGANSRGVYVLGSGTGTTANQGAVQSTGYDYSIIGDHAIGIEGTDLASSIDMLNGKMTVSGGSSYGIKSAVKGTDKFKVENFSITMTGGNTQTGIYSINGTVNLSYTTTSATSTEKGLITVGGNYSAGIYTGEGGSVVSDNYSYVIDGTNSSGIYASAGSVTLSNGDITLSKNNTTYGIYATSTETLNITVTNSKINVGYDDTTAKSGTVSASAGVFLSSLQTNSLVKLTNTSILSYELGIVSNGGRVELHNEGTNSSSIKTKKASAIAIRGGDVYFDNDSDCTIESYNTTSTSTTNEYTMTLPVRNGETLNDTEYVNTDGIYVNGGAFTSNGTLKLTHTGLQNATMSSGYNYASLVVRSFALNVLGGDVKIKGGTEITAVVGGGVYSGTSTISGSSISGNVELGTETNQKPISIHTIGHDRGNDVYHAIGTYISDSWQSYQSITGGHAIEVEGGSITVYNGTYTAEFGDGVKATGSGKINIYGGIFNGYMHDTYSDGIYSSSGKLTGKSGPSAFYGLKVIGGATVNIYNGTFDGGNGGAFVTGVTKISNQSISTSATANVFVYAGVFGYTNNTITATDGFNVYDDVNIVFGAKKSNGSKDDIRIYGTAASIAVNPITQKKSSTKQSTIYVYYGTYRGTKHGMYIDNNVNGNTFYRTYNTQSSTVLTDADYPKGDQGNNNVVYYNG